MADPTTHHRIHELLEAYWLRVRGTRALPREADIKPEELGAVWGSCFLVSIRANGSFAYHYLGDDLRDAYGDELLGREITETLLYPHPESLLHTFRKVVAQRQPVTDESQFVNGKGTTVKYRSCVLPLAGADGEHVSFLLGGMKWKAF